MVVGAPVAAAAAAAAAAWPTSPSVDGSSPTATGPVGWHAVDGDPLAQTYWDGTAWTKLIRWDGTAWVETPNRRAPGRRWLGAVRREEIGTGGRTCTPGPVGVPRGAPWSRNLGSLVPVAPCTTGAGAATDVPGHVGPTSVAHFETAQNLMFVIGGATLLLALALAWTTLRTRDPRRVAADRAVVFEQFPGVVPPVFRSPSGAGDGNGVVATVTTPAYGRAPVFTGQAPGPAGATRRPRSVVSRPCRPCPA